MDLLWPQQLELPLVFTTISSASYLQITVVFAFFYWLLSARVRAMVNVMATKIYEAYEGGSVKQSSSSLCHQLTQIQLKKREQLALNKENQKAALDKALFETKNTQWGQQVLVAEKRPVTGLSCAKCTPTSRKNVTFSSQQALANVNIFNNVARPQSFVAGAFATIRHCVNIRSHDFPYIYSTVLQDPTVQDAIKQTAQEMAAELGIDDKKGFQTLITNNKKRAAKILTGMHSKLSNFVIKLVSWILYKTLPHLFQTMSIPAQQLTMLKEASKKGVPIIYLPLHRSHMDYIAVTFTLCNNGLRSPLVAAGANLKIPFFGRILQGLGAFFIKRRIDPVSGKKDKLYRALLNTYMTQCIEAGHHFEFFIEGGRTRTGKPCMPKGGLLSVFVSAYLNGVMEDALLVPVSVNYDKVVEGSFVRELTGEPKEPESFLKAIKGIWKALTDQYGIIRVDFNQPFSLHELVRNFEENRILLRGEGVREGLHVAPSSSSLYGTDVVKEEQRQLVNCIARHIIYDCAQSTAIMSTNALAFLLLYVHREGTTLSELTYSLDVLRNELNYSGKDMGFCGESKDVLERAIELLGPGLVQKGTNPSGNLFLKPVTILPNVIELSYYSNVVLTHFALESVVALTLLSLTKDSTEATPTVNADKLIDCCVDLCEILQYEFIFTKTCQTLSDAIYDVLDHFTALEILVKHDMSSNRLTKHVNNYDIANEDEDEAYVPPQRLSVERNNSKLILRSNLIRPIYDAYYAAVCHVKTLSPSLMEENLLVKDILSKTSSLIKEGLLPNGETLSTESVRNCLKLFDKMGVAKVAVAAGKKIYSLGNLEIDEALERISFFKL